ncbi:MAG: hypothetical protein AB7T49_11385 [Oligoflexales bacterium]
MKALLHILIVGIGVTSCPLMASIVPPNNLKIPVGFSTTGVTEEDYLATIDTIRQYYQPIVAKYNGELEMKNLWTDPTVNAGANRAGFIWQVKIFGGLARHPLMTRDGLLLATCHEIGHQLAGYPLMAISWAAMEGQSDYFATLSCTKQVWKKDLAENAKYREIADAPIKERCSSVYEDQDQQDLCLRALVAAKDLSNFLIELQEEAGPISIETPDPTVVDSTDYRHPKAQCRLDTFVAGTLCTKEFDPDVIPTVLNEAEYACSEALHEAFARPRCWYKP